MSDPRTDGPGARYQIGAVARVTGISPHTLRMWERRYGAVVPARTPGGSRAYSDRDIEKLCLLKKLCDDGHSIGRIAHLDIAELGAMAALAGGEPEAPDAASPGLSGDVAEATRNQFLASLEALDITAAERLLLYAAGFLEPRVLILDIIAPIVREVGRRWERGTFRISHEHAASALLRNLLGTLMRTQPPRTGAATAVATTLSGELHELGVLMAALMAAVNGWKVLYLGPNLPADEILHVVEQSDAQVILLSMVDARNAEAARELGALVAGLPAGVELVIGGRSGADYRALVGRRAAVTDDLAGLEGFLSRARQ